MVTLHLIQQAHAHPAETVAQACDLTLADITQRAADGELECDHCGRDIGGDYHLHTIGGVPRPVCPACDAREPE